MRRAQLWSSLLILLALGGALALAGPGGANSAPATTPSPAADAAPADSLNPQELTRISVAATPRVAREVERVRGLEFKHLPKPEVVTSEFLNRLGTRQLQHQEGGLGLGADDAVGAITGLLADDEQLADAYDSTGDLAAAAYDPKTKRLYIVSDAVVANRALVEFVLAHELNHALEDQNFGIGGDGGRLDDDQVLARQALVEGSATELMTEFGARYLNPLDLLAASQTIDDGTGDVPKAFVDQLTWSYLGGMRFIGELIELGGGWKLVDYALESRPPASTEQVLHPRKYIQDERPSAVRIDPAPLRSRDWRLADRNDFGELPTDYLLRVGADPEAAKRAAAGWDGDRYELWRRAAHPGDCEYPCRSDLVLVGRWRWDTDADREQFDAAAEDYIEDGLDGEQTGAGWRVNGGWVAIAGEGRTSALAFAPDRGTATATAGAQVPGS